MNFSLFYLSNVKSPEGVKLSINLQEKEKRLDRCLENKMNGSSAFLSLVLSVFSLQFLVDGQTN